MKLNGTFLFRTTKELEENGWRMTTDWTYVRHEGDDTVVEDMVINLCGKQVTVVNGVDVHSGWNVSKPMVIYDEWIVDRILTKYSNG